MKQDAQAAAAATEADLPASNLAIQILDQEIYANAPTSLLVRSTTLIPEGGAVQRVPYASTKGSHS